MENKTTTAPTCGWSRITVGNVSINLRNSTIGNISIESKNSSKTIFLSEKSKSYNMQERLAQPEANSYQNDTEVASLIDAARKGQTEEVKRLIQTGIDINAKDRDTTALEAATVRGHIKTVKLLIENKADVNLKNKLEYMALIYAVKGGHTEIIKLLIKAGADVNLEASREKKTALIYAAEDGNIEIVKLLLQARADVNAKDDQDETALTVAAPSGNMEIIKTLVQAGADQRSIHIALVIVAHYGHTEIAKALIPIDMDTNLKNDFGGNALINAAFGGNTEIAKLLIEAGANVNWKNGKDCDPALIGAARYNNVEIIKLLIQAGADVNAEGDEGKTSLMHAIRLGHTEVIQALIQGDVDVNKKDCGITPLMSATSRSNHEVAQLLIQAGADVNTKYHDGRTALSFVATRLNETFVKDYLNSNTAIETINILVKNGANLRLGLNKTILDFENIMQRPQVKEFLENAMIEQLNQLIKTGYNDLRIEKADAEIARKLYKQPQYKDSEKLKETIKLFEIAIAGHIGHILQGAQLPIYPTKEKFFKGKLKLIQKENLKAFITVPDDTPQKHAIRNDSKVSGYFAEKSDVLGQNDIASLLGKYLEIQDIGRLRQVSKITKLNDNQLTTDDSPAADVESPILGQEDGNVID